MFRYGIIALLCLVMGCTKGSAPAHTLPLKERTTTIEQLHFRAEANRAVTITDDIIVSGRITSSDIDGNFFRSLIIEDESGAMELLIKEYDLSTTYPEGLRVALHLKGCAIGYNMGILQAGVKSPDYDYYEIGYLETKQSINRVVRRSTDVAPITPRRCSIADIGRDDCGRLVRIDDLSLRHTTSIDTLQGMTLNDATWQGYALFFDERGDSIAVYTSPDARFAKHNIPTTPLAITGIVQWCSYNDGEECAHLKMRYAIDYEESL